MSNFGKRYWESTENSIHSNELDERTLKSIYRAASQLKMVSKIILSTSGSASLPKLSVISKSAMLCSAASVNGHLNISSNDKWLCCLPTSHVSGLSIHARATLSDSSIVELTNKWSPNDFIQQINDHHVTLCSLVPSQLYDLVYASHKPNPELRALIIGGDKLNEQTCNKALSLGWPILLTYGMTETSSQIATEKKIGDGMKPLVVWDLKSNDDDEILVKGDALFDGYLVQKEKNWHFIEPFSDDGWFLTGDVGQINDDAIIITGRKDEHIKVLGEKINLKQLRSSVSSLYGQSITLLSVSDSRKGNKIVMVAEKSSDHKNIFNKYNSKAKNIERADELFVIDNIPRTPLGKLALNELYDTLEKRIDE